uniref:Thylakoid membrane protein n=2 Tax=Leptocylindrus danicus TaxID=163516 RepID=A0A7S2KAK2_9STRA|mmetsp:Transcript_19641/g.29192  ORF Transcript_19641/g.29192 Transcript_19641/m.29192 type:complete len:276 (+) Transcript_19641:107-934(+)|eukprot:CAMPEP_0116031128 /NCGR_PEP_ID=MMETSP0321-20121206/17306_1 /TAXON_ID=163516 /ORGANISM="Leptocylindrus danicus var. danicus, Strain B650" /LENGTH=275 /DNA_ID=CAMNT_0003506147 /DNA_START=23 /DNA_END=850 /DNA_ORIENTATION=+
MKFLLATILAAASVDAFVPTAPQHSQLSAKTFVKKNASFSRLFAEGEDGGWEAPKSAMIGGAGVNNAGEPPFEIRGFSLGNLVIFAGLAITVLSFSEYLGDSGGEGLNVSGLGFVYGIPVFLAGAALKYAEINPVPCYSTPQADSIFESKATEIIRKVKQDVTRHRYGDEAHLDTTVKKLGLVVPGKAYPQLKELRQDVTEDGELAFSIVWQSLDTPYKMWADQKRVNKYSTFFGPGVYADCVKIDADQRLVAIRLTTGERKVAVEEPAAAEVEA